MYEELQGSTAPLNPADCFCMLSAVSDQHEVVAGAAEWRENAEFEGWIQRLVAAIRHGQYAGPLDPSLTPESWSESKRAAAELLAIDKFILEAHPAHYRGGGNQVVERLARAQRARGWYNEAGPGLAIPRLSRPPNREPLIPASYEALFANVCWVPPSSAEKVDFAGLDLSHDLAAQAAVGPVRIAFSALVGQDDVVFSAAERHGHTVMRVGPKDSTEMRARIASVVAEVDRRGADILLLPEACLSPFLLDTWRGVLASPSREGTDLQMVLVGSGDLGQVDPPENTAVMLDGQTGELLWQQSKIKPFVIEADERDLYPAPVPEVGRLDEDLTPGKDLVIRDSRTGRLAIFICEDLKYSTRLGALAHDFQVTLVFNPVMSRPLRDRRWASRAAESLVDNIGAVILSVNSLVYPQLCGETGPVEIASIATQDGQESAKAEHPAEVVIATLVPGERPVFD